MKLLEPFARARIMLIDDTPANLDLLRALLRRAGLQNIHAFIDPREAVAQLQTVQPDLVLVDLHMPHLDGYAVLDQLRLYADGTYLPALMLTADTNPQAIQRALASGARDFLTKPFDAVEAALRVRNLLETRDLHQQLRLHNRWLQAKLRTRQHDRPDSDAFRDEYERIRATLDQRRLLCVFQPIFDLTSEAVVGVEALARFPSAPRRSPDAWFAEAADVGLDIDLEILAIDTALTALDHLPDSVFLAVNVSPRTLLSGRLGADFPTQIWPRVVLELTEHVPIEDYATLQTATAAPRERGARLAADDAGAGYAGFRHLLGLRPDIIKADLSLIRDIDTDPARRALTSALVQFSRDTDVALIAEGVETAPEAETLQHLGVTCAQGYHLSRPQPLQHVLTTHFPRPG
jgi:EAL domain-containing protein (putative c-di-GMP-specific phosphodiesterase class I)/FixJ family two-component response regulator